MIPNWFPAKEKQFHPSAAPTVSFDLGRQHPGFVQDQKITG
jgi:hypothetical protein